MAVQRVTLQQTEQALNVLAGLRLIRDGRDRLTHAKLVVEKSINLPNIEAGEVGSPEDFAVMEEIFGVPAGRGQEVYLVLLEAYNKINSPEVDEALGRLG